MPSLPQPWRYAAERLASDRAAATINREVGALKQALNLARKQGRLSRVPYIALLREDNVRQGFFEKAAFERVVAQLPARWTISRGGRTVRAGVAGKFSDFDGTPSTRRRARRGCERPRTGEVV